MDILLAEIHLGRVYTERRVAELKSLILEASRGSLKKHQILKLQGRLQFAEEGQLFGRAGRMMLHTLSNFIHNPAGGTTAEDCVEAMSLFLALLERGKPGTLVDARSHHQWMIFTDASYDPGHTGWECGIGAMLFSSKGELVAAFSFPLDVSMRAALGEQTKRTIIFEAEFLALVCAMKLWVRYLAWSPVVAFVDNNSARDVAISAKARSIAAKGLVSEYLKAEYDFGVIPWVCRVPSPSNCADMPSKRLGSSSMLSGSDSRGRAQPWQKSTEPLALTSTREKCYGRLKTVKSKNGKKQGTAKPALSRKVQDFEGCLSPCRTMTWSKEDWRFSIQNSPSARFAIWSANTSRKRSFWQVMDCARWPCLSVLGSCPRPRTLFSHGKRLALFLGRVSGMNPTITS